MGCAYPLVRRRTDDNAPAFKGPQHGFQFSIEVGHPCHDRGTLPVEPALHAERQRPPVAHETGQNLPFDGEDTVYLAACGQKLPHFLLSQKNKFPGTETTTNLSQSRKRKQHIAEASRMDHQGSRLRTIIRS
jgi:hypothetical protein